MRSLIISIVLVIYLNLVFCVTLEPKNSIVKFNITNEVTLQCDFSGTSEDDFYWTKEGEDVTKIDNLKERITMKIGVNNMTLSISHAVEDDAGNYTCHSKSGGVNATIIAANSIRVNTPQNVNVVEGEKLRIVCNVGGKPTPKIMWTIGNTNYTNSSGVITLKEDPEKKIENAVLLIDNINMTDRGLYKCIGYSEVTDEIVSDEAMVRIKDKYAALWPFLGICLEVFVLCAIILIYEKKRNKSELEESDTDPSPDQKNTPDHGKETNLRHRQ